MSIGPRIRELRRQRRWTQADLADVAGVGQATVAQIETGVTDARAVTLFRIARALEVEVGELFPRIKDTTQSGS